MHLKWNNSVAFLDTGNGFNYVLQRHGKEVLVKILGHENVWTGSIETTRYNKALLGKDSANELFEIINALRKFEEGK